MIQRVLRRRLALWAIGTAIGTALIALPDSDARVVSLSPGHGPSALDSVGIAIAVAAWLPIPILLCSRPRPFRGSGALAAASFVVIAVALLVVTIGHDLGWTWIVPVALLLGVQLVGLRLVWVNASAAPQDSGP